MWVCWDSSKTSFFKTTQDFKNWINVSGWKIAKLSSVFVCLNCHIFITFLRLKILGRFDIPRTLSFENYQDFEHWGNLGGAMIWDVMGNRKWRINRHSLVLILILIPIKTRIDNIFGRKPQSPNPIPNPNSQYRSQILIHNSNENERRPKLSKCESYLSFLGPKLFSINYIVMFIIKL